VNQQLRRHVVELQFGDGLMQGLADGAELLVVRQAFEGGHGRVEAVEQVGRCVVQQAFEALEVVHGHEQGVLEIGNGGHTHLHRRLFRAVGDGLDRGDFFSRPAAVFA